MSSAWLRSSSSSRSVISSSIHSGRQALASSAYGEHEEDDADLPQHLDASLVDHERAAERIFADDRARQNIADHLGPSNAHLYNAGRIWKLDMNGTFVDSLEQRERTDESGRLQVLRRV